MIVTVTANTAIDQTVLIPFFKKNTTMRAAQSVLSMGGKATDAAWILGELGLPSLALGFAAGVLGEKVKALLQARGGVSDFIPVEGETRLNVIIIDTGDQTYSTISTSSLKVNDGHVDALRARYIRALPQATCIVLGGTLPTGMSPSFYTDMIRLARERTIPVIFDAAEPNLSAGLAAGPDFIKPNRDELGSNVGYPIESIESAYRAGRSILETYGTSLIITLGDDGALAVLPDRTWRIPPLKVEVVSPAGAGDAVLAGLAASIHRRQPIEDGLRLGMAAAAAVCLMPGTADCRRSDVERLLGQVELIPYPG